MSQNGDQLHEYTASGQKVERVLAIMAHALPNVRFRTENITLGAELYAAEHRVIASRELQRLGEPPERLGLPSRFRPERLSHRSGTHAVGAAGSLGVLEIPLEPIEAVKLAEAVIFPVAAPALVKDRPQLAPADLADFNLLHESRKQWWADWLAAAGVTGIQDWRGSIFQNHLAIEAAEAGQGFALSDQILSTDSLVEGWLVRPFNLDMKDHWHYWIVRGKGQKETVPVRAFREWMIGEIADTNRKFAQLSGQKPPAVAGKPATA